MDGGGHEAGWGVNEIRRLINILVLRPAPSTTRRFALVELATTTAWASRTSPLQTQGRVAGGCFTLQPPRIPA